MASCEPQKTIRICSGRLTLPSGWESGVTGSPVDGSEALGDVSVGLDLECRLFGFGTVVSVGLELGYRLYRSGT